MIRRGRRRGLRARLKQLRPGQARGRFDEAPVVPIRARPSKIEFIEEYHYSMTVRGPSFYSPDPDKTVGEIHIMLPFDQMGQEALADAERHTSSLAGPILGRYGWLALTNTVRTDLERSLASVRPWSKAAFHAFPLVAPLLNGTTQRLEERVEAGWLEEEQLFYTPTAPIPYPLQQFELFTTRDSAVPTDPAPLTPGDQSHQLGTPNGATGQALALHVRLQVTLKRPLGVKEEDVDLRIDRLHINWPQPVVAGQFRLIDAPKDGRLFVDSRYNQVVVEQISIPLTSQGQGPIEGKIAFRIAILQPTTLQDVSEMKGKLKIGVLGMPLSGVRAQYFDAAGYLQTENGAGKPLIQYRTELHAPFVYRIAEDIHHSPALLERRYTWGAGEGTLNPFPAVEEALRERGFVVDPAMSFGSADKKERWWVSRTTEGLPLILDVMLERNEQPLAMRSTMSSGDRFALTDLPPRTIFTLTIRGYYNGPWEEVAEQMEWLEDRLRQRLHLRYPQQLRGEE